MYILLTIIRYFVSRSMIAAVIIRHYTYGIILTAVMARKKICFKNMDIIIPGTNSDMRLKYLNSLSRILARNFITLLKCPHESHLFEQLNIEVTGREHLDSCKDKPLLFISAHLGCFDLIPVTMSALGFKGGFVTKEMRNKGLHNFWHEHYRRIAQAFPISKKNASPQILKLLKQQQVVGFIMDQNMNTDHGVYVPFGDKHACTLKAPALLARKFNLNVIPVYLIWKDHSSLQLIVEPPLTPSLDMNTQDGIIADTARYNDSILNMIRRFPDQWIWMHRRFKNQPDLSKIYS